MITGSTSSSYASAVMQGAPWGLWEVLAMLGVVLWAAALVTLVISDMVHSAHRHNLHLPHGHHRSGGGKGQGRPAR